MKKRKLLIGALISMMIVGSLTGCGSSSGSDSSSDSKTLTVVDWGGDYTNARQKADYTPFEKQYGVKVKVVSPTDYGKLKAMEQSKNVEWDVMNVDSDFAIRGGKQGYLEKLDYNVIKTAGVDKDFISTYGIESDNFPVAISYNTSKYSKSNHPKTWTDFWDTAKYPGNRTMWKYSVGTLEAALLADGVAPDKLYPLDVNRAFKSLDKIKPSVKVWWTTGAQPPQMLASGDTALGEAWSGRITAAKKAGSPEDVEYNQSILCGDSWVVPKGAPNKALAMKFINFATQAKQQAEFCKNIDYLPTNSNAYALLPDDVKARLGKSADDASAVQIKENINWWAANYDDIEKKFEQWVLK